MNDPQQVDRLIQRLETLAALSDEEKQALHGVPMTVKAFKAFKADQDIVREGDSPAECCLVLEGMVFRYLALDDGRRQIMGFYIPGDIPDLQSLHIRTMDHSVGTLVPTTVGVHPASEPERAQCALSHHRECLVAGHHRRCSDVPVVDGQPWSEIGA
jgi:CRP-like cAMP-binding protein